MAEETLLRDDLVNQLISVGEADLLVAVPSYNNATTIGQTVQAIEESYQRSFIRDRVVILNVDGGSTDHTTDVVLNMNGRRSAGHRGITSLRTVHCLATQYAKSPSQGMALRTILATMELLRAKSCAVVSPATTNLDASWISNLLRPAYRQEFDFVAPLYARSKYQGLLARNLLYPMSRAMFGQRIREMYSEEWGFSGRLATQCLSQNVWNVEAIRERPEAWMAITAVSSGMKCCQSFLGPKAPPAAGTGPNFVEAVRQTVGNLFWCLENFQAYWLDHTGSEAVATFGPEHDVTADEKAPNLEQFFEMFRKGVSELEGVLKDILSRETHAHVQRIADLEPAKFRFSAELWVKTIYEFAVSYHRAVIARDHVVQAFVPLYRGQMFSFYLEHADSSAEALEGDCEALCLEFERQKPYLIERWKAKKAEVKS